MTRDEFKRWMQIHETAFPELSVWLDRQDDDQSQRILELWYEALAPVDYYSALDATKRMIAGSIDHPGRFDLSRLPATILRHTPRMPSNA
jgi:hypothetical protein